MPRLFPGLNRDSGGRLRNRRGQFYRTFGDGTEILIGEARSDMTRSARLATFRAGLELKAYLQEVLQGHRSGAVYYHPEAGRWQASKPGVSVLSQEYPAEVTSGLIESIDVAPGVSVSMQNGAEVTVGSTAEYSFYLNSGTYKMQPRMFLLKAFLEKSDDMEAIMGGAYYLDRTGRRRFEQATKAYERGVGRSRNMSFDEFYARELAR